MQVKEMLLKSRDLVYTHGHREDDLQHKYRNCIFSVLLIAFPASANKMHPGESLTLVQGISSHSYVVILSLMYM